MRLSSSAALVLLVLAGLLVAPDAEAQRRFPHVLIISIDTLRADHLGSYGYERPTSPHLDALLARGVRFETMRVPEPLTAPSMVSLFTGLHPHEHGTSRNGLRMRPGLPSLSKTLARRGYRTAAFVGNWTLRDELSGLSEHFDDYQEVFTHKRWFGMFNSEANGAHLTTTAADWVDAHLDDDRAAYPFLVWAHYTEPHAPYVLQETVAARFGIDPKQGRRAPPIDRYDTEIAFVDEVVGRLLERVRARVPDEDLLIVFLADHGESLGEHNYWGHGRHLYDVTLHVPAGVVWPRRVPANTVVTGRTSSLDLAPSVLALLGLPVPETFRGRDLSPMLRGDAPPIGDAARVTWHQAHRGAARGGSDGARRNGLLEIAQVGPDGKETMRTRSGKRQFFALADDPDERRSTVQRNSAPSVALARWLLEVRRGLAASDALPAPALG
ncbi:MAG: sulfatase, partial [Acidobacteriota bacterium]